MMDSPVTPPNLATGTAASNGRVIGSRIGDLGAALAKPFDFQPQTRVVFGAGKLAQLGTLAKGFGQNALLVSDKGLRQAGHEQRAIEFLSAAGLNVVLFDDVQPNPTTDDVARGLEVAKSAGIDVIIGLGGGSSMDCAKGINFLLTNGGRMEDYWGVGKATQPMLPMIAVPTTAGTGSEAQSFALIANAETHMKMACGDKKAACRVAVLDPELTISMPRAVTAATGIDAISHAVETYVTKPRNEMSALFSRRAWQLLSTSFPRVLQQPDDIDARGGMLLGAYFAGMAIENSMLGATHALANPLSAHFDTTHGVAIGVMLPPVVRYNAVAAAAWYKELAGDVGLTGDSHEDSTQQLAEFIKELVQSAGQPTDLVSAGADINLIQTLAGEAAEQWTGTFNPRPVDATSLEEIYRCAFHPAELPR